MTGERNESSVLFSIQMLVKDAPEPQQAAVAPKDESSSLIDLGTMMNEARKSTVASAPVLFATPAEPLPAPEERRPRALRPGLVLGGAGVVALAIVAVVSTVVALRPHRAPRVAELPAPAIAVTAPAPVVTAPPAETVTAAPIASTTPPPRPRKLVTTRPVTTTAPTTTAAPVTTVARPALKCCAGESELACQMRVSAGASCS
jgi:hypothetical protein